MTDVIHSYESLPAYDSLNRFSYCIEVDRELFVQKGKMIAYYGNLKFEAIGSGVIDIMVKQSFNAPLYINDFIIVTGKGKLILGDQGNDIASYDLEAGNLTVKSTNLLAFEPGLTCQECVVPNYLTLLGTGKFLASSNGPVHFMEPPARVDEQALLGWADLPCPSYRYDYAHVQGILSAVGAITGFTHSGEEKQVNFTGQGVILVQSSESLLRGRGIVETILGQVPGLDTNSLTRIQSAINERLSSD